MALVRTQKKQTIIEFGPDLYLRNEAYHLMGKISFTNFADRFYGIGKATSEDMKEEFTSRITRINLNLQAKIRPKLYAGLQYELEHNDIIKVEEDGELIREEILGTGGGTASGLGFIINRDARNNIFFPSAGDFYELSATLFRNGLGSSYDFTRYRLDFRKYFPLFSSHVLAFQGYFSMITGDPPFQMLSLMGGPNWMRGYYRGRHHRRAAVLLDALLDERARLHLHFRVSDDPRAECRRAHFYSPRWSPRLPERRSAPASCRRDATSARTVPGPAYSSIGSALKDASSVRETRPESSRRPQLGT